MASRHSRDQDNPWKEALELFLEPFLAFLFPAVHDGIDWRRDYHSLDKELQQVVRDARVRRRVADKLFQVWRKDGREAWLLIHIEIQGKREEDFPERMFVYGYRIYDRYRRPVVSLAVPCDDSPSWRPDRFEVGQWGSALGIRFLIAKLLDYRGREEELERDRNPFAAVVLAQLKVLKTQSNPGERWRWKVRLVKGLYDRGLTAQQVRELFRLLDWMVQLPQELEQRFHEEIERFEEERRMPYVTSIERLALQRGLEEGGRKVLVEEITQALETRFGAAGKRLVPKVRALTALDKLRALNRVAWAAETLEEVKAQLRS
jgi:hypothetical protein